MLNLNTTAFTKRCLAKEHKPKSGLDRIRLRGDPTLPCEKYFVRLFRWAFDPSLAKRSNQLLWWIHMALTTSSGKLANLIHWWKNVRLVGTMRLPFNFFHPFFFCLAITLTHFLPCILAQAIFAQAKINARLHTIAIQNYNWGHRGVRDFESII